MPGREIDMAIVERRRGVRTTLHQAIDNLAQKPPASLRHPRDGHLPPHELNGHRLDRHNDYDNGVIAEPVGSNGNGYFKDHGLLQKEPAIFANLADVPSEWILPLEAHYDPDKRRVAEVLGSHGNGKIARRSSLGRGPNHQHDLFVAGIYETAKQSDGASAVPELVNHPLSHLVNFYNGHEWFDIDTAELPYYKSYRDMRRGMTIYHIRWKDSAGRITAISIEEFTSHADRDVSVVRYSVLPENYTGTIAFDTGIDGRVDNKGTVFLKEKDKGKVGDTGIYYADEAIGKGTITSQSNKVSVSVDGKQLKRNYWMDSEDKRVSQLVTMPAEENRVYRLDNVVVVHSSRETTDPINRGKEKIAQLPPMETIVREHVKAVAREWEKGDVKVDGPEDIQRAIRYEIGQLHQFAWDGDERVSIPAKVAGESYMGHVFWDTEIFMLPFYTHTDPPTARALLMYRYNTLEPAKEKARKHGYKGALYAWESADTGEEATPKYVKGKNGELIRIFNGDLEDHISADIAYAVWEYVKATGDMDFLQNFGAEIIAETARFWASKTVQDSGENPQYYQIKRVIGPNEDHELGTDGKPGVDNNFFTNKMAQENLRRAIALWRKYPSLRDNMKLTEDEVVKWEVIADHMYFPYDNAHDVFDEHDGFKDLKLVDRSRYSELHRYEYQVDKQPDVLAGLLLGGESDIRILEKHWDRYFPIIRNGSSLSEPMLALYAARIGRTREAYKLFEKAAMVDIQNTKGNTDQGIHTATAGAVWWDLVYGFGGVELEDDRLSFNPHVPEELGALEFNVRYWGEEIHARVTLDTLYLRHSGTSPTTIEVKGQTYTIMPGEERIFDIHEAPISSNGHGNGLVFDQNQVHAAAS